MELTFHLDDAVMEALRRRAKENGRTVDAEATEIVVAHMRPLIERDALLERARQIRAMSPVPVQSTSSLDLIREDRGR